MTRFWSVFGFYLELRPYELEIHKFDISYQICWVLKLFILYTTQYERWDASIYFEKSDFIWNSLFQNWLPSFFLHKICCVKTSQRPNVDYKAIKIFLHFAYSCNFTIFMIIHFENITIICAETMKSIHMKKIFWSKYIYQKLNLTKFHQ